MERRRWWIKVFVLLCASLIPFGSHYLKHSLGPLKPYLVGDLTETPTKSAAASIDGETSHEGSRYYHYVYLASSPSNSTNASKMKPSFTHAEFGAFLGAVSWPNLVLPFLAGLLVDEKGHEFSALLFTSFALIGHVVFCIFLSPPVASFLPALAGRVVYGFGEGGTGIVQGAIIGTWFEGDAIAFSIGFTESIHYFANWLGKALPAAFALRFGGPLGALWFGSCFLFFSVVVAIVYIFVSKPERTPFVFALEKSHRGSSSETAPLHHHSGSVRDDMLENEKENAESTRSRSSSAVSWYGAMLLPEREQGMREAEKPSSRMKYYLQVQRDRIQVLPESFWLVGVMHFLFSNLHNLFGGFAVDYLHESAAMTPFMAGLIASLDSLLPIFVAPCVGILVDAYGGRLYICAFASLTAMIAFGIFLQPELTTTSAVIAMLLLSISTSTTPTLVKSAVPITVSRDALGTAFGVYSMFESLGGSVGHIAFGVIRDHSTSYQQDIFALFVLSFFSLLINFVALWKAPDLNQASVL